MSEEYKAKVFKSGNSVALRLPKALELGAKMPTPDAATVLTRFPERKK